MFGNRKQIEALEAEFGQQLAGLEQRIRQQVEQATQGMDAAVDRRVSVLLRQMAQDPQGSADWLQGAGVQAVRELLRRGMADAEAVRHTRQAVEEMQRSLAQRIEALEQGLKQQPPQRMQLGEVHQAPATGYVALWFDGGVGDEVQLLVGAEPPPYACVSALNCRSDINSYAGGVVRKGEYWLATSQHPDQSGVRCTYTPFL